MILTILKSANELYSGGFGRFGTCVVDIIWVGTVAKLPSLGHVRQDILTLIAEEKRKKVKFDLDIRFCKPAKHLISLYRGVAVGTGAMPPTPEASRPLWTMGPSSR